MTALMSRTYARGAVDTAIPGWTLQCVQTSSGALEGGARELHVPGVQVLEEHYRHVATNHYGVASAHSIGFVLPVRLACDGRFNGIPWSARQVCVWDTDCEFNAISPPGDLLVAIVDRELLAAHIRQTEHFDPLPALRNSSRVFETAIGPLVSGLRSLIADAFDRTADLTAPTPQQAIRQQVLETLAALLVDHLAGEGRSPVHGSHLDNVRRVRDLTMSQPDTPLQVQDVCRALQMSRSALQASFNTVLGMSPLTYLRALRLDGVRRDLMAGGSVKNAVEKWGFWHWSRFSQDYRRLFGELPSETLRRMSPRPSAATSR